jgi:predicted DNA-binding transcriptional regulator YafY
MVHADEQRPSIILQPLRSHAARDGRKTRLLGSHGSALCFALRRDATTYQAIARLLEAIRNQRVVAMRYHSQASSREKDYIVHPYRLVHVQGACT